MLPPSRLSLVLAGLLCASAIADTITLTTGEKVQGTVVRETDAELTLEIKVSAAVTDERVIPRATIAKIEKEDPEEMAWQAVKNIRPGVNSMNGVQYEALLRPLQGFLNDFPKGAHAAEASQLLAIFEGEKKRVAEGEVRLGERWLTKDEVSKERYQIGGLLAVQFMRSQRAAGDLIGALNSFDQLEKSFPGSKSFPDAVEAALETLGALKVTVERAQQTFKAQKAVFDAGVAASSAAQKPELLAARQRELAQGEAMLAAADKAKIKWPPLVARSDKNLEALAKRIGPEMGRLSRLDLGKMRQSVALAEQGQKDFAANGTVAPETLTKALQLWNANELARRMQSEATAVKTAAAQLAAAATPVPIATPTPKPTPKPTPRPRPVEELAPAEPEKPFLLTIGGMISVAVLLGLIVAGVIAYKKIKARSSDLLE